MLRVSNEFDEKTEEVKPKRRKEGKHKDGKANIFDGKRSTYKTENGNNLTRSGSFEHSFSSSKVKRDNIRFLCFRCCLSKLLVCFFLLLVSLSVTTRAALCRCEIPRRHIMGCDSGFLTSFRPFYRNHPSCIVRRSVV
jgi:hypothetical protein